MPQPVVRSDLKPPGVVLAGGLSRRMGTDKTGVRLGGIALLDRVVARLSPQTSTLAINSNRDIGMPPATLVPDTIGDHAGPLAGILAAMRHTALHAVDATHVATVPTDTPFFPRDLVARLQGALTGTDEIAIAFSGADMHPVFGLWPVSLANDLETFLINDDKRRVRAFVARHALRPVDFPHLETRDGTIDPFFNINTPGDLDRAAGWLPLVEDLER